MWLIRSPAFDVWQSTAAMAGCLFWLGAIWVMLAWMHQKPAIFTAGQIVFTAASVLATLSWLEWQQWIVVLPGDLIQAGRTFKYSASAWDCFRWHGWRCASYRVL